MSNITDLIRPELLKLKPYSSARREASGGKIWLNANESPFAPTTDVDEGLNRYPEPQHEQLIQRLAEIYHVNPEQMLITCGSDQGIDLLIRLFCRAYQDSILITPPTFEMYNYYARHQAANIVSVPLDKEQGFILNVDRILAKWTPTIKMIFLASPNNPTANIFERDKILQLCEAFQHQSMLAMLVVDEAYNEFTEQESLINKLKQYKNLIILRTLSKAYGLAGARVGVTIANPEIIYYLQVLLPPYAIPKPSVTAVLQALAPEKLAKIKKQIGDIIAERNKLAKALATKSDVVKVWPSETNFLLIEVKNARVMMNKLIDNGVIVRDMSNKPGLENCLRVTVGLPEENQALLEVTI